MLAVFTNDAGAIRVFIRNIYILLTIRTFIISCVSPSPPPGGHGWGRAGGYCGPGCHEWIPAGWSSHRGRDRPPRLTALIRQPCQLSAAVGWLRSYR